MPWLCCFCHCRFALDMLLAFVCNITAVLSIVCRLKQYYFPTTSLIFGYTAGIMVVTVGLKTLFITWTQQLLLHNTVSCVAVVIIARAHCSCCITNAMGIFSVSVDSTVCLFLREHMFSRIQSIFAGINNVDYFNCLYMALSPLHRSDLKTHPFPEKN